MPVPQRERIGRMTFSATKTAARLEKPASALGSNPTRSAKSTKPAFSMDAGFFVEIRGFSGLYKSSLNCVKSSQIVLFISGFATLCNHFCYHFARGFSSHQNHSGSILVKYWSILSSTAVRAASKVCMYTCFMTWSELHPPRSIAYLSGTPSMSMTEAFMWRRS